MLGQSTPPTPPADVANLTGLTTPVEVRFSDGRIVSGSGFFYFVFGPPDPKNPQSGWVSIDQMYLVTAKHIVQPKRLKDLASLRFFFRVQSGDHADWYPVEFTGKELAKRLHLCRKEEVDVAVVDLSEYVKSDMAKLLEKHVPLLQFNGVNPGEFPGKSPIQVQPGDDVIVIGYPSGSFDQFNKLPILKTGLLNTPLGLHFNGLDAFLIDFKYYEGSSGSLIITRPTHISFNKENRLQSSQAPQYVFLGVYEGETYWNDVVPQRADLGLGWYYYNVEEAISNPPVSPQ